MKYLQLSVSIKAFWGGREFVQLYVCSCRGFISIMIISGSSVNIGFLCTTVLNTTLTHTYSVQYTHKHTMNSLIGLDTQSVCVCVCVCARVCVLLNTIHEVGYDM